MVPVPDDARREIKFITAVHNYLTKAARSTWARLIKKVYEVDPLICPLSATQSTAR